MPNHDGTGPAGRGPGMGRGVGRCGRDARHAGGMGKPGTGLAATLVAVAVEGLAQWLAARRRKQPEAPPPTRRSRRLPDGSDDKREPGT